jgi:hypothetical protein
VKLKTVLIAAASCAAVGAFATAANAAGLSVAEYDITNIDLSSWMEFSSWKDGWDEMFRQAHAQQICFNSCPQPTVTPLPAALPLYGAGMAVMGAVAWRRKRKASKSHN